MTPSGHTFSCIKPEIPGFLSVLLCLFVAQSPAAEHWSLRALTRPPVPESAHPIDAWIGQSLAEKDLLRNPPADRHTLLRRATLDLTGLPPTREQIAAFLTEESPDAWEKLIERLLASPHYGERWGRHWLDVARYVQGTVKVPGIDKIDLAEPYRDYVVRSFNGDKPYDRFLSEQIAGDLLAGEGVEGDEAYFDRITAPAFLSIGQWFEECTDPNKLRLDIIDEQISTATRAFLAMDFSCARCHDHKFDPVSIRDYYALAGIFRSTEITSHFSEEWKDGRPRAVRALASGEELQEAEALEAQRVALQEQHFAALAQAKERVLASGGFGKGTVPGTVVAFEAEDFDGQKELKTIPLGEGEAITTRRQLDQWVRYRLTIPEPGDYTLLVRYASSELAPVELEKNGETDPERILSETTFGESPEHLRWEPVPLRDLEAGTLFLRLKVARNEPFPVLDHFVLVKGTLESGDTAWRTALGPPTVAETRAFLNAEEREAISMTEKELDALGKKRPAFPLTLAVHDAGKRIDLPVHPGGEVYAAQGEPVPRGNPGLAGPLIQSAFPIPPNESGRVQFAQWLTHPDHPLTARVMANRVWHWHFGTGLVRTTDDFGRQGSPPTHPELLDWLAAELIESGWSIKHLHRLIMSSETYRASSLKTPANLEGDSDGLLLSRFPSRRLEVEAIYDSMLTSIGKVPRQAPGAHLDTSRSKDRALYILTSARSPIGLGVEIRKMFPLFGFDDSGRPMHQRDESSTPAQSLWWLNNPLPRHYAEKLAEQLLSDHPDAGERTLALYEIVLGRPPESGAEAAILNYAADSMTNAGLSETEAWTRICLGLFSSHSFRHLE